jgi:hypothetical protein
LEKQQQKEMKQAIQMQDKMRALDFRDKVGWWNMTGACCWAAS